MSKEKKITISIWIVTAVILVIVCALLPDRIPIHFNIQGKANRYGSKYWIFALAPIPYLIYSGISKK